MEKVKEELAKELGEAEEEDKQAVRDKMPKHMQRYEEELFLVAPYFIGNEVARKSTCLDQLSTEDINLINERTCYKLTVYKDYL
jgi:hypothetical protein